MLISPFRRLVLKTRASRIAQFHVIANSLAMPAFKIRPIPLFEDNYCWRIDNESNMTSVVVDPAIAATVLSTYGGDAPELVAVLTTHYHGDHSGGNEDIAKRMPDIDILGGAHEAGRVPAATRAVTDGEEFELAGGMRFKALHTPCHTKGHICYVLTGDPDRPPAAFTGDTLFAGGCGKFFEGDAVQMYGSLKKLTALPKETEVYCGHEYTVSNLKYCAHVEPDNAATRARLEAAQAARAAGRPTVPSTLAQELATNVFLRTQEPAVIAFTHPGREPGGVDPVEVLHVLRDKKNSWKPT